MKKFLIGFAVFAGLLFAGAYALLQTLSVSNVEAQVIEKFHDETGRDISFDAMHPALFFPNVGLRLRNVKISNAPWAHDKDMLELQEVDLHLALQPLFHHQVEVASLTLSKPVIHLEVAADGGRNWDISKPAEAGKPGGATPGESAMPVSAGDFGFKFGHMQINGAGVVTYRDDKKGTEEAIDDVNASLSFPDLASALGADGEFNYKGQRVNYVVNLTKPMVFFKGGATDGDLTVKMNGVTLAASGNISMSKTLFSGHLHLAVDSLSGLAGWIEGGKTKLPFEKLALDGSVTASASAASMTGVKLSLDDLNAGGDINVDLAGKPDVHAKLAVDHIDLDKFVEASKQAAADKGEKTAKSDAPEDWSTAPMDFDGLKKLDAEVSLDTKGFTVHSAEVGPSTLTATLKDGALHLASSEAAMFGGKFSAELGVTAAAPPAFTLKFNVDGVQAKPMLEAFSRFKRLQGASYMTADLTASGDNQKAIMNSLAGKGTFDFKNGAIEGIDLSNLSKLIQTKLKEIDPSDATTQFADVHGTYTVTEGVLHNDDLKLTGPIVESPGSGTVDFAHKYLDYNMEPVLSPSSEADKTKGLTIPVHFVGPFGKVRIRPDFRAAWKGALDKPGDIKDSVKALKEQGKEVLKELRKDPDALQKLFGHKKKNPPPVDTNTTAVPDDSAAPAPAATPDGTPAAAPPQ